MKIKKILLLALAIALPIFLAYLLANREALNALIQQLHHQDVWLAFVVATLIMLSAHLLRAYKTKFLTDSIKTTSLTTHTRGLFIGYLFNALLPLRLGEFFRAIVIGKGTHMSSAFIFGLVLFDRAVDGIILGAFTLFLLLTTNVFDAPGVHSLVRFSCITLFVVGSLLLGLLFMLRSQPAFALRWWHRFTGLFNDDLRDSLRFKMWTLMYGLERVFLPKRLVQYAAMSVLMWAVYIAAMVPLVHSVLPQPGVTQTMAYSNIGYLGVAAPAGPAHIGSYQTFVQPFIDTQPSPNEARDILALAWLLQVLPAFIVGLVFVLATKETLEKPRRSKSLDEVGDKLLRNVDISRELSPFLDSFFTNSSLSKIMHRLEVSNKGQLVRYFKGGSNAVTALVKEDGKLLVRKVTPLPYKYKLKSQYDWLQAKSDYGNIVNVISEETTKSYYKIDLEYSDYIPYFQYIHKMPHKKSEKVLKDIVNYLFANVYQVDRQAYHPEDFEFYFENRCLARLRLAADVNDEIRGLLDYKHLIINGQKYDNIPTVVAKIQKDEKLKKMLSTYRRCSVHGDPTVDNILVSKETDDFLLIDPSDNENEISGPVYDFGRIAESLRYGYEFHIQDDRRVEIDDNKISFEYSLSSNYADLYKTFVGMQKKYLTAEEQASVPFHTAVFYSRMLTHRVVINPLNAAKFYAISVIAFNDFLKEVKAN